jgi:hypothetical protein
MSKIIRGKSESSIILRYKLKKNEVISHASENPADP